VRGGWWYLLFVPVFGTIIAYNLITGIAYGRMTTVYRATDPFAFWFGVGAAAFGAAMSVLACIVVNRKARSAASLEQKPAPEKPE